RLEAEHDNIRESLAWLRCLDGETGLRLAAAIWRLWYSRGYFRVGYKWLNELLAMQEGKPASARSETVRAHALNGAGVLALKQTQYDTARELFEASLRISRELGDLPEASDTLNNLGNIAFEQGDLPSA